MLKLCEIKFLKYLTLLYREGFLILDPSKCYCLLFNSDSLNNSAELDGKTLHAIVEQKVPILTIGNDFIFKSKTILNSTNQKQI